jgi:hypothetical protein
MKDFLRLRPVHYYREHRVRAHVLVCVLAYLLETALEVALHEAGMDISARKTLGALGSVHLADNRLGDRRLLTVTRPSPQVQGIVAALGLPPMPRMLESNDA